MVTKQDTVMIEGEFLVIRLPRINPPQLSKSGKNALVASTSGNMRTTCMIDGKAVVVGVNAYIPA